MKNHRKILFLPRWYPTAHDLQNGVFIQKHAKAAAIFNETVVLIASPIPDNPRITKSKNGNLNEVIIYYRATSSSLLNFIRYVVALFRGWQMIKQSGFTPELCHVNMLSRPALLALWLKYRFGIPFILSEHWSGYITGHFEKQSPLKKWFIRYLSRKASMVTAVSEPLKKAMIQCGLNTNIIILPNAIEVMPNVYNQLPVIGTFRYLMIADLKDEIKNISGVIRAYAEVHKKEPATELAIIGDGKDRRSLEKQAMECIKEIPSVQFLGEKSNDEVLKVIPTAHAVIINSRIETFSVVTLEAIFSGRPVIATRCGGPEQFVNSQNGILIDKDNDRQLEEAMIKIKKEYNQYPPEKVKNSIPDNYNLNAIADALNKLYSEVLSKSSFVIRHS